MLLRHQHRDAARVEVGDLVEVHHDPPGAPLECRPELGCGRQIDLTGGLDRGQPVPPMHLDSQVFVHRDLRGRLSVRVRSVVSIRSAIGP